jgi:hypothetical protein
MEKREKLIATWPSMRKRCGGDILLDEAEWERAEKEFWKSDIEPALAEVDWELQKLEHEWRMGR